jgi:site-specific DNA recombinase
MNSLKPRPAFQVLVMSEESRLGREAIETAYALKQLVQAGVRVFFYLEDRERTLDSPTDKIMLSLTAFADELEREKARQRTYDAMHRKAKAGHVTGGRVFGYDNVEVVGLDGKRSHVVRRINEGEAAIVRRIFEMCAAGTGYTRIAKTLNAEGVPCPRPQQGRPSGWAPTSVHEVLKRPLYVGAIVWNQTRKRNRWGQHRQSNRPGADWITVPAPELRIVSNELWQTARARLDAVKAHIEKAAGKPLGGRRRDIDSQYLMPGFSRCGVCGGAFCVMSRAHGKGKRGYFYGCASNHKRGGAVCSNSEIVLMDHVDAAILDALDGRTPLRDAERLRRELATVEQEASRLSTAIATGGDMAPLLAALQARQLRRQELTMALAATEQHSPSRLDRRRIEREVREKLRDWRGLLTKHIEDGRELLRQVLSGPVRLWPVEGERRVFRFEGTADLGRLFSGVAGLATCVASPTGTVLSYQPTFRGEWLITKRAA